MFGAGGFGCIGTALFTAGSMTGTTTAWRLAYILEATAMASTNAVVIAILRITLFSIFISLQSVKQYLYLTNRRLTRLSQGKEHWYPISQHYLLRDGFLLDFDFFSFKPETISKRICDIKSVAASMILCLICLIFSGKSFGGR